MKKINFLIVIVLVAFLSVGLSINSSAAAGKKVITWRLQDQYASGSWPAPYLTEPLIKWVEEATNGRLKIKRYEPGALSSVGDTFDALGRGVFDVAFMYPGFYTGSVPEANIDQGLPWGWTDAKAQTISMFNFGMFDLMEKVYAKHNVKYLVTFPLGDVYSIGTFKPVKKLEDLKGLKIRAVGIYAEYVRALGASPVSTPFDEIYMALKLGTVDGFLASVGQLVSNNLGEVIPHYLLPTTSNINCIWAANMNSWNKLPEDIKKILTLSAPKIAVYYANYYSALVENSMHIAEKKYGVKFHTLSKEDQKKAIKMALPLWEKVAKMSPDAKKAVEIVKKTNRFLGRMD